MSILLAIISGILTSVMIVLNGRLAEIYDNYNSSIFIHFVGLISIILILIFTKSKFKELKKVPFYLYSGGAIGVLSVYFNNLSYMEIGVTITLALILLGQTLTSMVIDQFGLFGMEYVPFQKKKMIGVLLIVVGIIIMFLF